MDENPHMIHTAIGELRGRVDMMISRFDIHTAENRKSHHLLHGKVDTASNSAVAAVRQTEHLERRVENIEPVVKDYEYLRQRWKAYAVIVVAVWIAVSGLFAPVVGGFLQRYLFGV